MTQLHETIASDQYWNAPAQPELPKTPFLSQLHDVLLAPAVMTAIDDRYRALAESHTTLPVPTGEPLSLPGSGLLKVVEDMRTRCKQSGEPVRWRSYDSPEEFDEQAGQMTATTLFNGVMTGTRVEGPSGVADVARRVMYLINAPSSRQLAGKESHLLGHGGHMVELVAMRPYIVGHVRQRETRKEIVQTRIVSAQMIVPAGLRKAREHRKVFDLKLPPLKISPAGAV